MIFTLAVLFGLTLTALVSQPKVEVKLKVFHAGSLTGFVEELGVLMKQKFGVKILNEPSGSVDAVRKVVDLNKEADLVMVADYRLIPNMMFPTGKASWCLVFASNEVVIVFSDKSRYADRIGRENWLKVLMKPDVRVGFSDPNRDPCGYRSLMVLGLASLTYNTTEPLTMLKTHANVDYKLENGKIVLDVSDGINPDSKKIFVRAKSVDLLSLVESGVIDYAFEYKNVAVSHNLSCVELPEEVNLANPNLDKWYSNVAVKILGAGNQVQVLSASSIAYGLTVPTNSPNPEYAEKLVELILSKEGKSLLASNGFKPLENPFVVGKPPIWLQIQS